MSGLAQLSAACSAWTHLGAGKGWWLWSRWIPYLQFGSRTLNLAFAGFAPLVGVVCIRVQAALAFWRSQFSCLEHSNRRNCLIMDVAVEHTDSGGPLRSNIQVPSWH